MRVAMLNLTGGGLSGGYRKYLESVAPRLHAHPAVSALRVVVPPGHVMPFLPPDVALAWTPGEQWRGFPAVRRAVAAWPADVVLVPTARVIDCGCPCVSMVRNMEPLLPSTPGSGVSAWLRHRLQARIARHTVKRATRVLAVSDFVRDFLVDQWHAPAQKIDVVPHGVDTCALPSGVPVTLRAFADAPFLFGAGSLLAYRGFEDIVRALAVLPAGVQAIVAGSGAAPYRERLETLAREHGVSDRVHFTGNVDGRTMAWAYDRALAYVMTSRMEACPNTVLEALAQGAVSISTRCRPMPEFYGDVATYYDAGDANGLAARVREVMALSADERGARRDRARQRAADFTWNTTVERTVQALLTATRR